MVITWLRWLFFGKNLSEILDTFEKTNSALERFHARTDARLTKKKAKVDRLGAQIVTHAEHMSKAKLVQENLTALMTEKLGKGDKAEGTQEAA